ncbi:MAG: metallophosphoesterase [Gammaproteobacteria bacterium]|nr:metallophosphoesterase [Gammaproteobacteria bacterium]
MTAGYSFASQWFNHLFMLACLFVFGYPAGRLCYWYFQDINTGTACATASWVLAILATRYSFNTPKMKLRYLVVHWMGASFVFASITLLVDILRLLIPMEDLTAMTLVVVLALTVLGFAVLLSHIVVVRRLTVPSPKVSRRYRIAQISDVHIGSRQKGFMQRIVTKLNSLEPDFIVVTGDLVDSSAVEIEALESIKALEATTLFTIGNHERYADLPKIIDMADSLGMITLRQQTYHSDQVTFSGIDDADDFDQVARQLPQLSPHAEKFNVLLYHRPVGWESAIESGIDLMLSGHTHNGQIFPFNWVVRQQFRRIAGLYEQGSARLYVSSGTGTWGPLMRLGSLNEVTLIELIPEFRTTVDTSSRTPLQ